MKHKFVEDGVFTDDMPFGEFIRKKRRLMGMNQSDFADWLCVCNRDTLSKWELGVTSPPIEVARELVKKTGGEILIVNREIVKNETK